MKKLIFGIGNPGPEYQGTRHNVGRDFAVFANGSESDVFMNTSGLVVKKFLKEKKCKPVDLVVAHDDIDIPFGEFKISFGRNSGGHKGVQSIIDHLHTNEFWRVRIGIAPANVAAIRAKGAVADFVLAKFSPSQRKQLPEIFHAAYEELKHRLDHP